jgi:hypothetical protein
MKTKQFFSKFLTFATATLIFVSCNKNDTTVTLEPTQSAEDSQVIADETEDIYAYHDNLIGGFSNMRVAATDSAGKPMKLDKCATTKTTTANGIVTTVIDFGLPHTCNGKTVGGKMTITIPVKPTAATGLFTENVVYQDFQRGTRKINGKHSMTVTLENGKPVTKESFTETTITLEDGKVITFSSTKTRKIDLKGTATTDDDEVSITGATTAVGSDGKTFKSTITKALVIKISCQKANGVFPVSGTVEVERTDKPKDTIDYGNGACDRIYTVNGVEKTRK